VRRESQSTLLLKSAPITTLHSVEDCLTAVEQALEWASPSAWKVKEKNMKQFYLPLPEAYAKTTPVAHWDDVPPMSEDYNRFRDLLIERVKRLLEELGKAQESQPAPSRTCLHSLECNHLEKTGRVR
jgi:hypothetical protein